MSGFIHGESQISKKISKAYVANSFVNSTSKDTYISFHITGTETIIRWIMSKNKKKDNEFKTEHCSSKYTAS